MPLSSDSVYPSYLRAIYKELRDSKTSEEDPYKNVRGERLAEAVAAMLAQAHTPTDARQDDAQKYLLTSLYAEEDKAPPDLIAKALDHESDRLDAELELLEKLRPGPDNSSTENLKELTPLSPENIEQFIRAKFPGNSGISIENFSRPTGVFSKEIYKFDIVGLAESPLPAILRRDRNFEIVPSSASREYGLLNELHDRGFPVAKCLAAEFEDTVTLKRPCLLMERLDGASIALSGDEALKPDVLIQMASLLARLHTTPVEDLPLPNASRGQSCRDHFLAIVDTYRNRLHTFQREPSLVLEASLAWLYAHSDLIDDTKSLVHADYDLRNVLFDGEKINAVLDFELSHIGHPGEDLGYLKKDLEEHMPWPEFIAAYEAAGGPKIDPAVIHYFMVWSYVFQGICNVTAFAGFQDGIHNDVFLGTLPFVEFQHIQRRLIELIQTSNA